jgi:hypothetical protein
VLTLRWVRAPAKARGGATILSGHYRQPPPSIFTLRRREKKRMIGFWGAGQPWF